jgi:hypothetical protein
MRQQEPERAVEDLWERMVVRPPDSQNLTMWVQGVEIPMLEFLSHPLAYWKQWQPSTVSDDPQHVQTLTDLDDATRPPPERGSCREPHPPEQE